MSIDFLVRVSVYGHLLILEPKRIDLWREIDLLLDF